MMWLRENELVPHKWEINEHLDRNHIVKCLKRKLGKIFALDKLKAKLQRSFQHVLNFHGAVNEETVLLPSVPDQFQWRHEHKQPLPHRKTKTIVSKNSSQIDALDGFPNDIHHSFLFGQVGIVTQACESFHSLKAKLVTKDCARRES
jgi:hypothetical protein